MTLPDSPGIANVKRIHQFVASSNYRHPRLCKHLKLSYAQEREYPNILHSDRRPGMNYQGALLDINPDGKTELTFLNLLQKIDLAVSPLCILHRHYRISSDRELSPRDDSHRLSERQRPSSIVGRILLSHERKKFGRLRTCASQAGCRNSVSVHMRPLSVRDVNRRNDIL